MRLAALALVVVAACGGDPKPAKPEWDGPALGAAQGTATEYAVTALTPADPEVAAGKAIGAGALVKQEKTQRGARVFAGTGGAEVHVRPESPTVVFAQRPAAPGALPDDTAATASASAVLTAYGMDPAQWEPRVTRAADVVGVRFEMRADRPVFEARGTPQPLASFSVDAGGVRTMTLALVRFTPRQARIVSEQEAFGKLTLAERYEAVRLVLVNDGKGLIRPYWEFRAEDGALRPVLAVLTP